MDSVWARLDCALGNAEWMRKFANAKVVHISTIEFDNCMLSLQWDRSDKSQPRTGKLFHFEVMWLRILFVWRWSVKLGSMVFLFPRGTQLKIVYSLARRP